MIDPKDWKWYGTAAHFICGHYCRFHLATLVGDTLVSTVGQMVPPYEIQGGDLTEDKWLAENPNGKEIGLNRFYETMTFKAGKPCRTDGCNCGLPLTDGESIDFTGYNYSADATRGHYEMCMRVAERQ